jgi:signal transduction histidine kinase
MAAASGEVTIVAVMPVPRPWLDWAIAGTLTALGVLMTLGSDHADDTIVDSIVVAAVTVPVLWRRSAPLAAAAALAAGTVVSAVPTFDQSRCGVAIPAALLIVFSLAARCGLRRALGGLALILAGMVVLLLTDPLLDVDALFILPLCAGVWWTGRLVRSRNRIAAELAERSQRLVRTRDERASLAVDDERATIAAGLESAARPPLRAMVELADAGGAYVDERPERAREAFETIELQGRELLDEMRQTLGKLRADELDTSPQPGLADLDGLLARARAAGAVVDLRATGPRRALPAGIELAGYRMVQHALEALAAIEVTLRYLPDALEVEIRGEMIDDSSAEAALAAARERITAHGGSFSREHGPGRACVLRSRLTVVIAGG